MTPSRKQVEALLALEAEANEYAKLGEKNP